MFGIFGMVLYVCKHVVIKHVMVRNQCYEAYGLGEL
jgi:hypothetical protein